MLLKLLFLTCAVCLAAGSRMEMPSFVNTGSKVQIECVLDHEQHEIQHFLWYKDNRMFYKYVGGNDSDVTNVALPDVPINIEDTKMDTIILNPVGHEAAGIYTCEMKSQIGLVRMSGTLTVYSEKE